MNLLAKRALKVGRFFQTTTGMTKRPADTDIYEKAEAYWSETASNVDGMLGGFEQLHVPDINASKVFLMDLKKKNQFSEFGTALDCGAGIGRITKHLLLPLFKNVDMVDVTSKFIEKSDEYIGPSCSRVQNRFVEGLQTFEPQAKHYDIIWIQWVIGHLTDEDCLKFFQRCKDGLTENGCIILKDNHSSGQTRDFDDTDYSWTRTKSEYLSLFEQAGLNIVSDKKQNNFPKDMYQVRMYALKASKSNV